MTVRYTKDHEYIRVEGDTGIVGITDYAQGQLGDVVYVELPTIGKAVTKGGEAAVVESVKAASEVYAPVSGEVVEVNSALEGAPGTVNEDPAGGGWSVRSPSIAGISFSRRLSAVFSPTGTTTGSAMQRSPAEPNAAPARSLTTMSRSASGMTIMWFLAPPKACTRFPFEAPRP